VLNCKGLRPLLIVGVLQSNLTVVEFLLFTQYKGLFELEIISVGILVIKKLINTWYLLIKDLVFHYLFILIINQLEFDGEIGHMEYVY
jgi:hypothetical protein